LSGKTCASKLWLPPWSAVASCVLAVLLAFPLSTVDAVDSGVDALLDDGSIAIAMGPGRGADGGMDVLIDGTDKGMTGGSNGMAGRAARPKLGGGSVDCR
jgi:hypothetical protein